MNEEVFRFGENDLGFGIVALPEELERAPLIIIFNAGLIHREGPYRLNTLLCRAMAGIGYIAVRLDLSGKGDSPAREGLSNRESVSLDWKYIKQKLTMQFGERKIILIGLCSGADNAIKIAAEDKLVQGLVLLDAVSPKDKDFARRELMNKLGNIHKWINLPFTIVKRIGQSLGVKRDVYEQMASMRDEPTIQDVENCFQHMAACNGRVLAVFTSQAIPCYNQQGQFVRALNISGLERCCEEIYWPQAEHLYPVQIHRDQLVRDVSAWGKLNLEHFQSGAAS